MKGPDDRVCDNIAVAIENRTMKARVTRRIPSLSTSLPIKGMLTAPTTWETKIAVAKVVRSQPNSLLTGFRKSPKVKRTMGLFPTTIPSVAPKTTHQGFLNARFNFIAAPFARREGLRSPGGNRDGVYSSSSLED